MVLGAILSKVFVTIKNVVISCVNKIKLKSQDIKEHIKNYKAKKEQIKLIESGSIIVEPENNVVKEVFDARIVVFRLEVSMLVTSDKHPTHSVHLITKFYSTSTVKTQYFDPGGQFIYYPRILV